MDIRSADAALALERGTDPAARLAEDGHADGREFQLIARAAAS
jgi:hypothetical protein